ncbi:hypothetical protein HY065_00290 [Candidatus Berkelbacteria bacterium]|nr:hypothetical protein [Candidatus Berkelbacteria bacterium]
MPTTKMRINISLSDSVQDALAKVALRDRVPTATKAARLLEVALELEEDQVWDTIAQRRDSKNARYVAHRRAWQ